MGWPIQLSIGGWYDVGQDAPTGSSDLDVFGRLYGVDLRFKGEFEAQADGDLRRTQGLGALIAAFERALITSPGELFWRPGYGVGATEFLNLPASAENLQRLKNRVLQTLADEPAIEEVESLDLVARSTGLVEAHTIARVAGQSQRFVMRIGHDLSSGV